MQPRGRCFYLVELRPERKDMKQRVKQRVADLLHEVGGAGVAHEGRTCMPAHGSTGE